VLEKRPSHYITNNRFIQLLGFATLDNASLAASCSAIFLLLPVPTPSCMPSISI